jgi:ElaB/YqjD/DUF883 family membrane-anchored ribosome-binding protein
MPCRRGIFHLKLISSMAKRKSAGKVEAEISPAAVAKEADLIVAVLDLSAFGALDGSEWMLSDTAKDSAQDELLSLGISADNGLFEHANTRAAGYAAKRSAELVKNIDEWTHNMPWTKIASGFEAGLMREDLIRRHHGVGCLR